MKNYFLLLLLLTTFSFGEFNYHLELASYQVTPDTKCFFGLQSEVTEINGANVINTCYITTDEGYVVIDSGPTYYYAKQAFTVMQKEKKLPIKYLINTSSDEVHVLGNQFYEERGAVIIGPKSYKSHFDTQSKHILIKDKISNDAFENTSLIPLHIPLNKNKNITVGSTTIEIKKVESKEAKNLLVYLPKSKVIFAGNFISQTPSLVKQEHYSEEEWAKNLKKIEKLAWRHIIPSHGVQIGKKALAKTKEYLKAFQKSSKKIEKKVMLAKAETLQKKKSISHKNSIKRKTETSHKKKTASKKIIVKKVKRDIPSIQYTNYQRAKKLAIKEHKYVLIKYQSEHCPPCIKLDKEIKRNGRLRELIVSNTKAVKINPYYGDQTTDFDMFATPTVIVFEPATKKVLIRLEGEQTFKKLEYKLSRLIKNSPQSSTTGNFLSQTIEDNKQEEKLLYSSLSSSEYLQ